MCSASVIISVIGVPTAPRRRIIRCRWIVRRGGWVVVPVRVIIRAIIGVRERRAEREGSEPEADCSTGADPIGMGGPGSRRRPDSGKHACRDGQPATGFPKNPANRHKPSLAWPSRAGWPGSLRYNNERAIFQFRTSLGGAVHRLRPCSPRTRPDRAPVRHQVRVVQ